MTPETLLAEAIKTADMVRRALHEDRWSGAGVPCDPDGQCVCDAAARLMLAHVPLRDALTRGLALTEGRADAEARIAALRAALDDIEWHLRPRSEPGPAHYAIDHSWKVARAARAAQPTALGNLTSTVQEETP